VERDYLPHHNGDQAMASPSSPRPPSRAPRHNLQIHCCQQQAHRNKRQRSTRSKSRQNSINHQAVSLASPGDPPDVSERKTCLRRSLRPCCSARPIDHSLTSRHCAGIQGYESSRSTRVCGSHPRARATSRSKRRTLSQSS
jgi:hypothetical protein